MTLRRLYIFVPALAILLLSLPGALAAPGAAEAAKTLSFDQIPNSLEVTSWKGSRNIGRVKATGIPRNRIRYSIEGAHGFSVHKKNGQISYDGAPPSASTVSLTVTASDTRGKAGSVSAEIPVTVNQPSDLQRTKDRWENKNCTLTVGSLRLRWSNCVSRLIFKESGNGVWQVYWANGWHFCTVRIPDRFLS